MHVAAGEPWYGHYNRGGEVMDYRQLARYQDAFCTDVLAEDAVNRKAIEKTIKDYTGESEDW